MKNIYSVGDCLFNLWYVVIVIAYLIFGAFPDVKQYFIWLKPLPVLLLVLQLHGFRNTHKSILLIEVGLFFGMIGDTFLQVSGSKHYFQIGVAAFFVGHLFYICGFLSSVKLLRTQTSTRSSIFFSSIYGLIAAGGMMTNLHYIWKNLEIIDKIGFSVYAAGISFMSISAFYFSIKGRYDNNLKFASVAIFLGSVLFMISDTMLSEKQRNDSIDGNTKKIMSYVIGSTYWLAQFLITQGGIQIARLRSSEQELNTTNYLDNNKKGETEQTMFVPFL